MVCEAEADTVIGCVTNSGRLQSSGSLHPSINVKKKKKRPGAFPSSSHLAASCKEQQKLNLMRSCAFYIRLGTEIQHVSGKVNSKLVKCCVKNMVSSSSCETINN